MTTWDRSVDTVIVGSGGGGLAGAIAIADAGLDSLVIEKLGRVGGSTAMSGGVIWLPNNPLMRDAGVVDSHADGLAYLDAVVGEAGLASSPQRREMFLTAGSEMIEFLQKKGVHFVRCPGYSDYYDTYKGGNAAGRSIEPRPFDERRLGDWKDKIQAGQARRVGLHVKTNEIRSLVCYNRSARAFAVAARVWLRTVISRLRGQDLVVSGESLIAQMLKVALDGGVPVWTDTALDQLVSEGGRVVGVRVVKESATLNIEARKAVLLAAGGFAHNAGMRRQYSGEQFNEGEWSVANPGDTGEVLAATMDLAVMTDLLDEAWWLPSPVRELGHSTLSMARNRPGGIYVDGTGRRFCNEANSYVEVGKAMYSHNAVPCWLIFDDRYRRRYAPAKSLPGRLPREWIEQGLIKKATTIEDLAVQISLDPDILGETVRKFNIHARQGTDPEFGRGRSAYNICMGDPGNKPNPSLGPIDEAPFYATQMYPSDVGTCGGLVTNEYAQVLDPTGLPVPGLYATGNITATVMGRTYPGAGASIANSMIFGYVAARHLAGRL